MSSPPSSLEKTDHQIRARLLGKLGIYDMPTKAQSQPMTAAQQRRLRILRGMGVGYSITPSPPDGSARRMPLNSSMIFHEPLKGDRPLTTEEQRRRICFEDKVEVLPIPTRNEYSDRIKSRIWSNRHELQENAERNAIEFASEGWDWRQVTEDSGMYICSVSGELVHPIHLQQMMEEEAAANEEHRALERGRPVHSK